MCIRLAGSLFAWEPLYAKLPLSPLFSRGMWEFRWWHKERETCSKLCLWLWKVGWLTWVCRGYSFPTCSSSFFFPPSCIYSAYETSLSHTDKYLLCFLPHQPLQMECPSMAGLHGHCHFLAHVFLGHLPWLPTSNYETMAKGSIKTKMWLEAFHWSRP